MVLKARSDGFNLLSKPGTISMPSEKLSGLGKQQKKTGKIRGNKKYEQQREVLLTQKPRLKSLHYIFNKNL